MYYPWSNVETSDDKKCMTMTAKKEATWEQVEAWLTMSFGKDKSVEWRGFGEIGKEFIVAVMRKGKSADESDDESDYESETDDEEEEHYYDVNEDMESIQVDGEELWLGVKSGFIFRATENGDIKIGVAGQGTFKDVKIPPSPSNAPSTD